MLISANDYNALLPEIRQLFPYQPSVIKCGHRMDVTQTDVIWVHSSTIDTVHFYELLPGPLPHRFFAIASSLCQMDSALQNFLWNLEVRLALNFSRARAQNNYSDAIQCMLTELEGTVQPYNYVVTSVTSGAGSPTSIQPVTATSTLDFVNDYSKLLPAIQSQWLPRSVMACGQRTNILGPVSWVEDVGGLVIFNGTNVLLNIQKTSNLQSAASRMVLSVLGKDLGLDFSACWGTVQPLPEKDVVDVVIGVLDGFGTQSLAQAKIWNELAFGPKPEVKYSEKALLMKERREKGLCLRCGSPGIWISLGCYCKEHGKIF